MIQSISITKYVYNVLSNDDDVKGLVGNKIYALRANTKQITYPFIAFSRTSLSPQYTKDYNTDDTVYVSVAACSNKYMESVDLAEKIRMAMYKLHRYSDEDVNIMSCRLTNVTETFESDTFMQILDFELSVK